jgi:uncharacterized protein YaeQ
MALNATLHSFEINLSDSDRGVYQSLAFRAARHPSETAEYLVTRVLAYCLEYGEGLHFSKGGLSEPDTPALMVHDLTGAVTRWIEIGLPEPARLHRATKSAAGVAVYAHKEVDTWLARLDTEQVHRARDIEIYAFDRELIAALSSRLERRMCFDLVTMERHLYVSWGEETLTGGMVQHHVGGQR